jgi:transcriptional regulator with XRE-family HTH domain
MEIDNPPRGARTLAEKLDHLFATVRPGGRAEEYTYREVAAELEARGGPKISATYLWQLRKGIRDNPTRLHLVAIADFFGVSAAYFLDDAVTEQVDADLDLLVASRDPSVRLIALRSAGLSPGGRRAITEMIEHVRAVEGLSSEPDRAAGDDPPAPDSG